MLREQCQIGMTVSFGRENGQATTGIVEKLNPKSAKIRSNESRGRATAGTIWRVPYSLLSPAGTTVVPQPAVVPQITYSPFQDYVEQCVLEGINACYNALSPENLTCDGEAPLHRVNARRSKLQRQLRGLFQAFGREVDEMEAFNWSQQKEAQKRDLGPVPNYKLLP
jgi:hypothetical protein